MAEIPWTPDQREAIHTVGRSVAVSAAAGSGKTAVLAERCARLVCDAPQTHRCGVDELLVVTFTDAAAGEMKARIRAGLQARLQHAPSNAHLREQVALVETAQISTIHAFCNWIVRRWFQKAGIDPAAALISAEEAVRLKAEVIDNLANRLYASDEQTGHEFRALVDVYGLGDDGQILRFIRRLADYLDSLPDPRNWLETAMRRLSNADRCGAAFVLEPLVRALRMQEQSALRFSAVSTPANPTIDHCKEWLADFARQLTHWRQNAETLLERLDADSVQSLLNAIRTHEFPTKNAPRRPKDASEELDAQIDALKTVRDKARKRFDKYIRDALGSFTLAETRQGLSEIEPFLRTIANLTSAYREAYATAKRAVDVLDFSDQESFAFKLTEHPDVVAALRRRFKHVLVDEYQDISPLQDALLLRVSRPGPSGLAENLFTVGDVKQSIYRFRDAEPSVFRQRMSNCKSDASGRLVRLNENFRSRPEILEAANAVFTQLMCDGENTYTADDALKPGRPFSSAPEKHAMEVHLLDKLKRPVRRDDDVDDEAATNVDPNDPSEWQAIEREAYVIAGETKKLVGGGWTLDDGRPVDYGDIAILLRSQVYTGDVIARFLDRCGIPAVAQSSGSMLDTVEARDVRALLEVIDNQQQDIPLAAVLRSPVLGLRFSEDDLLAIRQSNRSIPFHAAFRSYADRGRNAALRSKVKLWFATVERYRRAMRERPFHEVLIEILEQRGYLAYVGGRPGGLQRRRILLKLCERAKAFASFRNQDVHAFVRFVADMEEDDRDIKSAGRSESNAVQIMSIHQAKGLEFPVVFMAGLGTQFNLKDRQGRMIFERSTGIGLNVVDPERMIEYPSAAKRLVAERIDRETRAEEIRLLYVAMTRAKDRLFLVGTTETDKLQDTVRLYSTTGPPLTPADIVSARSPLEWIVSALCVQEPGQVAWPDRDASDPLFRMNAHRSDDMRSWDVDPLKPKSASPLERAVARLEPLPADEPMMEDTSSAEAVIERIRFDYPHLAVSSVRSVVSASEIKRPLDTLSDPDEQIRARQPQAQFSPRDRSIAIQRGTATHTLLQFMRLDRPTLLEVRSELTRLIDENRINDEAAALVDTEGVEWLLQSDLGQSIRRAGDAYRREFMFIAAQSANVFDPSVGPDVDDRVVVRGVVDGIIPFDDAIEIVDYKTDAIEAAEVPPRAERYAGQMSLYAAAMEPIFQRPVRRYNLAFIHARRIHTVDAPAAP